MQINRYFILLFLFSFTFFSNAQTKRITIKKNDPNIRYGIENLATSGNIFSLHEYCTTPFRIFFPKDNQNIEVIFQANGADIKPFDSLSFNFTPITTQNISFTVLRKNDSTKISSTFLVAKPLPLPQISFSNNNKQLNYNDYIKQQDITNLRFQFNYSPNVLQYTTKTPSIKINEMTIRLIQNKNSLNIIRTWTSWQNFKRSKFRPQKGNYLLIEISDYDLIYKNQILEKSPKTQLFKINIR